MEQEKQLPVKLPRLSEGSRIQKRPAPRAQQPISVKSRLIYVSSTSPFISVVKRVRKHLDNFLSRPATVTKGMPLPARIAALKNPGQPSDGAEAVVLGTGKAIERVLNIAAYFSQQGDCDVEIRTKTVSTVDDVVDENDSVQDEGRVRKMSALEVRIRLKD